ncbi:hypothetical protein B0H13DRAFT_2385879 [Mycena leptocephala]|nr:hypothetical protein B0H13DRAFT_2385879 [Mycena leptocephala]
MSADDLWHTHDVDSPLPRTLWSSFPFRSSGEDSEDETDSDVSAAAADSESENDLDIDPADLEKLHELEMASQQSDNPTLCAAALNELQHLGHASTPLSPFAFRVLGVLAKFLAVERIPEAGSIGHVHERLIFSAVSALWSYGLAKSANPDDVQLDDACVRILPKALQWIRFLHTHFLGDVMENTSLCENAWGGAIIFLDLAVGHPQMFGSSSDEITLAVSSLCHLSL